ESAVFEGMRRVPPGSALVVDAADAASRLEAFWQWPQAAECDALPESEAIEQLRAELSEAVRIRLRSDVPLGAFLSGGVDSAAVLALMAKHSPRPVQTFTIGFGDPAYDELDDARATAAAFRADHHEQVVTPDCIRVAEALASSRRTRAAKAGCPRWRSARRRGSCGAGRCFPSTCSKRSSTRMCSARRPRGPNDAPLRRFARRAARSSRACSAGTSSTIFRTTSS